MEHFDTEYLYILVKLVIAHLTGDFLLQPDRWVDHKRENGFRSPWLYIHSLIHSLLILILVPDMKGLIMALIVFAMHTFADIIKSSLGRSLLLFFADQAFHLAIILLMWLILYNQTTNLVAAIQWILSYGDILIIIIAYIIVIWPASHIINLSTSGWNSELEYEKRGGLKDAGKWIGRLERFLALTFILIGHFPSVGFLIAAKSIFRFGDLRESRDRKRTEYILIGTLLSFSIAFTVGLIAKLLI